MEEFACRNVYERDAPVLVVVHDHDGGWQLLCGGDEHDDAAECVLVHVSHLTDRDRTIVDVLDLPPGWQAERGSPAEPWPAFAVRC